MTSDFFDYIHPLPNPTFEERTRELIGFEERYARISGNLRLILEKDKVKKWSTRVHGRVIQACNALTDRHPLVLFEGDVGTGKTVSAEATADRLCRDLDRQGQILKLSTRVRGKGLHGEMSRLLNDGFRQLIEEAGKRRLAFLLIDEADALGMRRDTVQMHQEEKAGVNTLIQKLDELRDVQGRAIVFLTTNRPDFLDPALIRRASVRCTFGRPTEHERDQLLTRELEGIGLSRAQIGTLVEATGPSNDGKIGFSYSDIRLRLLPEAIAAAYPNRPITFEVIQSVLSKIGPSPVAA